jgi:hypothetical protein
VSVGDYGKRRETVPTLKVDYIDSQGDRVLLYPKPTGSRLGEFHVIAKPEDAATVQVGDTIEYEPYGFNFGWLKPKERGLKLSAD